MNQSKFSLNNLPPHTIQKFKEGFEQLRPLLVLYAGEAIPDSDDSADYAEVKKASTVRDFESAGWEVGSASAVRGSFFPMLSASSPDGANRPTVEVNILDSQSNKGEVILTDGLGNKSTQDWISFFEKVRGVSNPFGEEGYLMLWPCPSELFGKPHLALSEDLGKKGFSKIEAYIVLVVDSRDNVPVAAIGPGTARNDVFMVPYPIPIISQTYMIANYAVGLRRFLKGLDSIEAKLKDRAKDSAEKTTLLGRLSGLRALLSTLLDSDAVSVQTIEANEMTEEAVKEFRSFTAAVNEFQSSPNFVSGSAVLQ